VTSPAHHVVVVRTTLSAAEWCELYRETVRAGGLWRRAGVPAVAVPACGGVAVLFGAPPRPALLLTAAVLVTLAALLAVMVWTAPRLRWRHLPDELRRVHWTVTPDDISTTDVRRPALSWNDVDRLVLGHRLVVVQLCDGLGGIGLPRRDLTARDEALLIEWADDSGADLRRRRPNRWPRGGRPGAS